MAGRYGFDVPFDLTRYDWEPDYLKDKELTLERFSPAPDRGIGLPQKQLGGAATGFSLASLIPGLGALGPLGAGLGALASIVSLFGSRSAAKEEEERRRKQEALQRAAAMSRSFEQSGWGGY